MDRTTAAVEACLKLARGNDRPFIRVTEYISKLRDDPAWTDADIVQVQTKVIRALMRELGKK